MLLKAHYFCFAAKIFQENLLKFMKSYPTLFRSILGTDFYYNHVFKFVNCKVSLNFCLALNMLKYTCIFEFSKTAFRSTFWKRYSKEESILNLVKYSDIKIVRKKSMQLVNLSILSIWNFSILLRIENLYL